MKKIKLLIVGLLAVILLPLSINAASNDPIKVYIFKGEGCPHCAEALEFFSSIESEYGKYFDLVEYEVFYDEYNATLMTEVAAYFGEEEEVKGVPYIIIGDKTFQGYAGSYDEEIKNAIVENYNSDSYSDKVEVVKKNVSISTSDDKEKIEEKSEEKSDDTTTIIVIAVATIGFIALFYFARDSKVEDEIEEIAEVKEDKQLEDEVEGIVEVEEDKQLEVEKTIPPKKSNSTKTTTTKKVNATKKTTTSKKTPTKKTTTTKKTPAKKNNN